LKEKGIDYDLKYKKETPQLDFPLEVIEGDLEYFKKTKLELDNFEEVREYLKPKIEAYLEKSLEHYKEKNITVYKKIFGSNLDNYTSLMIIQPKNQSILSSNPMMQSLPHGWKRI
jgi:hypothetical protein